MRRAAVRAAGADERVTLTHPASQYRFGPELFIHKSSISPRDCHTGALALAFRSPQGVVFFYPMTQRRQLALPIFQITFQPIRAWGGTESSALVCKAFRCAHVHFVTAAGGAADGGGTGGQLGTQPARVVAGEQKFKQEWAGGAAPREACALQVAQGGSEVPGLGSRDARAGVWITTPEHSQRRQGREAERRERRHM
ncbi:unnamed protein product [Rangifer tarandus platyrhynchus]|uniref:Uncharacterized protein n=1 Tax=Rangifer tarandus platyrhynchus TaxID=3082113 RepID=A0ABN8YU25_RANTA|nr:unnamed protein product [Rangifer tarandus platyrhynchus]